MDQQQLWDQRREWQRQGHKEVQQTTGQLGGKHKTQQHQRQPDRLRRHRISATFSSLVDHQKVGFAPIVFPMRDNLKQKAAQLETQKDMAATPKDML